MSWLLITLGALAAAAGIPVAPVAAAAQKRVLVVERAVLVIWHGIRAPLDGEVPAGTRTAAPWPTWPVAESRITLHVDLPRKSGEFP